MVREVHPPAADGQSWALECQPAADCGRLTLIPTEVRCLFLRFCLEAGRECDASALVRTNKELHRKLNPELYHLVLKYETFHIVHWAAMHSRVETLRIAFEQGADPNQLWTSARPLMQYSTNITNFRPAGYGLDTSRKLLWALYKQLYHVGCPPTPPSAPLPWEYVWFSRQGLSKASLAQLAKFWTHYYGVTGWGRQPTQVCYAALRTSCNDRSEPPNEFECPENEDARFNHLSSPPDSDFTFPEELSPEQMDKREVKLEYIRLFQCWHAPLHTAARFDNAAITAALLANGADMDETSVEVCSCSKDLMPSSVTAFVDTRHHADHLVVFTPLHVAVCKGSYDTAKVLVSQGARRMTKVFHGTDEEYWTTENPLHVSLYVHHEHGLNYDFIEFLLKHGFPIEERNHEDLTPLMIACNGRNDTAQEDVVKLLLRYGADPNNPGPRPPGSNVEMVWLNYGDETATPLIWAIRKGQFRLARLLLHHGADAKRRSSNLQSTALTAACSTQSFTCMNSSQQDIIDFLDALLANSTAEDVNAFDAKGINSLMRVIGWSFFPNSPAIIEIMRSKLLEKGADILAGHDEGRVTPFEHVIRRTIRSHPAEFGGAPPAVGGDRLLAILQAFKIHQQPKRPKAYLNQFWDSLNEEWPFVVEKRLEMASSVLHALIRSGFSPAETDENGDTAMTSFLKHIANKPRWRAFEGSLSEIKAWFFIQSTIAILQENGAALHVRNKKGYTAFDYLQQIVDNNSEIEVNNDFAQVMDRLVKPGKDEFGNLCFKFHPTQVMFGDLSGHDFLRLLKRNKSRWLVCETWCTHYCGNYKDPNGDCECARTAYMTVANCAGACCSLDRPWFRKQNCCQ